MRRAFLISLIIHLMGYGGYRAARHYKVLENSRIAQALARLERKIMPPPPKVVRKPPPRQEQPVELTFAMADPSRATAAPPEAPKFYGPVNNVAANPTKTVPTDVPQVDGPQKQVIRTTENEVTQIKPTQPKPPVEPPQPDKEKEEEEKKPAAKPKTEVGDLAMAKLKPDPLAKTEPEQTEKTGEEQKPKHKRPRRLSELAQGIKGERMAQNGGVARIESLASLDTKSSITGDYDYAFVAAVQARWDSLLEERGASVGGKVVLQFVMHSDGTITGMQVIQESVGEALTALCERAVLDPAPFDPWSPEMKNELHSNQRTVQFTFWYLTR